MGILTLFKGIQKPARIHRENNEALAEKKKYTEEELAALILKELGVSDVIIANPTAIYQLKQVMLRCLIDCADRGISRFTLNSHEDVSGMVLYNHMDMPDMDVPEFSLDNFIDLVRFMRTKFAVLKNGAVRFELYEYFADSEYQVKRYDGQIETQRGIKAYRFTYSPEGDTVLVKGEGCELRTTKVAERLKKEAKEKYMTEYTRTKINQAYDPAILKTVKRIYNSSGVEMLSETIEGQSLYYFPYQSIANRKEIFDALHFDFIKQNRTIIERRADNLAIATITLIDDDPKRNYCSHKIQYAKRCTVNSYVDMTALPYLNMGADVATVRESFNKGEKITSVNIGRAELYDNSDDGVKRTLQNEILESIDKTRCLGEKSKDIRSALREMALKQFEVSGGQKSSPKQLSKGNNIV